MSTHYYWETALPGSEVRKDLIARGRIVPADKRGLTPMRIVGRRVLPLDDAGRAAAARDIADPHGRMARYERTTHARADGKLHTTRAPFPSGEARRSGR